MTQLPVEWVTSTIGECFLEIKNGTTSSQNKNGRGNPVSRIETIQKNKFDLNRVQHLESPPSHVLETYRYQKGDIAFSHINSYEHVGKTALYEGDPEILIHGMNLLRLRLGHHLIDPKYAHYFMLTEFFRDQVRQRVGHAVNQVSINQKRLAEVPFIIAPLNEQRRIVAKVEKLLSRVDLAQARLATILRLLKRFRQSVLAAAFSGRITADWRDGEAITPSSKDFLRDVTRCRRHSWSEKHSNWTGRRYPDPIEFDHAELPDVPSSWEWTSADAVCSQITDGEHIQPPYQSKGYPMLSAKHVRDGVVTLEGAGLISEGDFRKAVQRCAPANGDILIVSVGATTGRSAVVENCPRFAIVRSVLLLKPLISTQFLLKWLQSPWCFRWMSQASGASAQPHLYIKDTRRMPVPIPPVAEQQEILRRVEALFKTADALEARYRIAKVHVDKLTQSILAKAFRGELVPQHPNDEPASVLLDRIRKRQKPQENKNRRRVTPQSHQKL
jgi:Restriction endonuclease S subunits